MVRNLKLHFGSKQVTVCVPLHHASADGEVLFEIGLCGEVDQL